MILLVSVGGSRWSTWQHLAPKLLYNYCKCLGMGRRTGIV